jgi:crotonobetainyl-CoA:carnitine CoA-transferase CaiB-like acyl-CoA transferase
MSRPPDEVVADVVADVAELVPGPTIPIDRLDVAGTPGFASAFDVDTAAMASAALANLSHGVTELDAARVAALFATAVRVDGEPLPAWADLSGYYRTRDDGWIQFHCNFPHHAAGVVSRLACEPTTQAVQEAVLDGDPDELEARLIDDGMIAARMRTLDEWAVHPHAIATQHLPLISVERIGDGLPRHFDRTARVLDCSRVLAGPVAGMTLAAHGADVLRVGAQHLPSVEIGVISTGFGKRNAFVDVTTGEGRATFAGLLAGADVWIDAYRPGTFERHGFGLEAVTPGSVVVQLCAFDWVGPWAGRRGFDSIVQTTTGIAAEGMTQAGADRPTPLPVQALDYCTGLLAAFAARRLIAHQATEGGTWLARLSLLRTRNWLVGLRASQPFTPTRPRIDDAALHTVTTKWGQLTGPLPIGGAWSTPPSPLGTSEPTWRTG